MRLVAAYFPEVNFQFAIQNVLALLVAVGGLGIVVAGGWSFRKAHTTVNPIYPQNTTSLVQTGVYSLSRNPMYLGFLFILTGWGLALGSYLALLVLPLYIFIMTRYQIRPEEKILRAKFKRTYQDYAARVRRWI